MTRVRIESIAAGGDGVGRADGMVVFVPRAAPGDLLDARLAGKKRFARGAIMAIETPSPERVTPLCQHYARDRCGGCQLQHMAYSAQLGAKATIIRDGLTRIGKREVDMPAVEASPTEWRYRSKLTLAIARTPARRVIGLHPFDDAAAVFQLEDCPITDERVVSLWRLIFEKVDLLPARANRGVVSLATDGSLAVVIEGDDAWHDAENFFAAIPSIGSLWFKPENRARKMIASRVDSMTGASFAQVNRLMAESLHGYVMSVIDRHSPRTLVDAYAGSGATAKPLAARGIVVTAIEMDRFAAASTSEHLKAPSQSLTGRVEELLPRALPADVVVLNPPRTGLDEAIPAQLESASPRPRAIIYVSCNPATLGRDVARLPGYRIASLKGFDMFPQTAHVETVCELVPVAA